MRLTVPVSLAFAWVVGLSMNTARAQVLDVSTTVSLGGVQRFTSVRVRSTGRIVVPQYDGADRVNTGNLVLLADSITIDAGGTIDARGAGYQARKCGDGSGPAAAPMSGGRGGCGVRDSGGGGAHFGNGGRGTKDIAGLQSFPRDFEEDCINSLNAGGTACTSVTNCRNNDGLPTVAGQRYFHSVYDVEFGAAGGDKGCRDGDGFEVTPAGAVAGGGGGRVVLVSLTAASGGVITINGTITANGRRGCGIGNDSAGGGAGGSVFIVGDRVDVGATGVVTAAGGRGGDTFAGAAASVDSSDCPAGSQTGGTCDDCGGGGGGGIISIQSRARTLDGAARFDVGGALGGVCPICTGEAGGGAGELQLNQLYVGEVCDGYDNDFDGAIDEELGDAACGLGSCATTLPVCAAGLPPICVPVATGVTCTAPFFDARPRVSVILDTSASMLTSLDGYPTFGDGSVEQPGLDTNGDGSPNDSRLYLAREALGNVISAYPEIDFALARYHADQAANISCQTAAWIECAGLLASYDEPADNTGTAACTVRISPTQTVAFNRVSTSEACINYAGSCGPPRRGADILSGFGSETRDLVRWLDGRETDFRTDTTPGNVCDHAGGGDCEVRGTGGTPITGSLEAIEDYITPIRATDPATGCRNYSVILVTDGAESCNGDPIAIAQRLHDVDAVELYVVAVSVLPSEEASLNAIAAAGSGGARVATFVRTPDELVPALTAIVAGSIRFERCNGVDDNCNGLIDEGFDGLGEACDDGGVGVCRGTGTLACSADESSVACTLTAPGTPPGVEVCNGLDDDCDEQIDEGLTCTGSCVPSGPEVCNGADDDCDGAIDEADPALGTPCGLSEGSCTPGSIVCIRGTLTCSGAVEPRAEVCNGVDDDCSGVIDNEAPCPPSSTCLDGACRRECDPLIEFNCPFGFECLERPPLPSNYCLPTACAACTSEQRCDHDTCVGLCDGVSCAGNETCVRGACLDCHTLGCPTGELCSAGTCVADPCLAVTCGDLEGCFGGSCRPLCDDRLCPTGTTCDAAGSCGADACAAVRCNAGQICESGACRDDVCAGLSCPVGDVCVPGRGCTNDPCTLVDCPAGHVCALSRRGDAQCFVDGEVSGATAPVFVAATGGGGFCSASAPGHSPSGRGTFAGPALAVLALLAARARRRRRSTTESGEKAVR
jgi:hypothetical protein